MDDGLLLVGLMALAAFLYSSVGHAGASGYLAAMALVGMSAALMKPTALILNVVVASIAALQFARAGQFSWALFWPFALSSIPCAFFAGMVPASGHWYRVLVGVVLAASAAKLLWDTRHGRVDEATELVPKKPRWWVAMSWGALIGTVAGLTGTGGGIFLSPLLLVMGWGRTRQSGGVAALFILVNSLAGLLGNRPDLAQLSPWMPAWIAAVVLGGTVGSYLGSRRIAPPVFKRVLALVLVIAAVKFVAT